MCALALGTLLQPLKLQLGCIQHRRNAIWVRSVYRVTIMCNNTWSSEGRDVFTFCCSLTRGPFHPVQTGVIRSCLTYATTSSCIPMKRIWRTSAKARPQSCPSATQHSTIHNVETHIQSLVPFYWILLAHTHWLHISSTGRVCTSVSKHKILLHLSHPWTQCLSNTRVQCKTEPVVVRALHHLINNSNQSDGHGDPKSEALRR